MKILRIIPAIALLVLVLLMSLKAVASEPRVVVTLKPIHSLVSGVMEGVAEPVLLLTGGESPHDYSLRPSDVRLLNQAQVVFWIGEDMETFLAKPLANASNTRSVALAEIPDLDLLPLREGGLWEGHGHDDDGHAQDEHGHHAEHDEHDHEKHGGHAHGDMDLHIWLNPQNAIVMVRAITAELATVDPVNQDRYQQNTAAMLGRLTALDEQLESQLEPVRDTPYLVFHDGYQYFEQRYALNVAGSLTVNPEQKPGAKRIQQIRNRIQDNQIVCVFSEPQFESALIDTLLEDTSAKRGVLDPLGIDLTDGTDAYFQLMSNLAISLRDCLGS